jgi:hypothetical protein
MGGKVGGFLGDVSLQILFMSFVCSIIKEKKLSCHPLKIHINVLQYFLYFQADGNRYQVTGESHSVVEFGDEE